MTIEEEMKYKLDAGKTLFCNIFWILICFIAIGFFIIGFNQVQTFDNETNHLLGMIIISMATIRILSWNGHPTIYLKEKD